MPHRTAFEPKAQCRTQLRLARDGVVSPEMVRVAEREQLDADTVGQEVEAGRMIIPANIHHTALDPMAIGLRARENQRQQALDRVKVVEDLAADRLLGLHRDWMSSRPHRTA